MTPTPPSAGGRDGLRVSGLRHEYRVGRRRLTALDNVTFEVPRGTTLGVVGESGCGKSTLARALLGLIAATAGTVDLGDMRLQIDNGAAMRNWRRRVQLIFQDPMASLDPRMTAAEAIAEPLRAMQPRLGSDGIRARVADFMAKVGLRPEHANRYPHEFSGGQCQRIGIARALVVEPAVLVCDEPVSALDVSIRAQIMDLLLRLQRELQLTLVFIAHDLAVVRQISHRVLVMYLGRVMECNAAEALYRAPSHPYTRALLAAVPQPVIRRDHAAAPLPGEPPSPLDPPPGCVFHARCPWAIDRCRQQVPPLRAFQGGFTACHRAEEVSSGPG